MIKERTVIKEENAMLSVKVRKLVEEKQKLSKEKGQFKRTAASLQIEVDALKSNESSTAEENLKKVKKVGLDNVLLLQQVNEMHRGIDYLVDKLESDNKIYPADEKSTQTEEVEEK